MFVRRAWIGNLTLKSILISASIRDAPRSSDRIRRKDRRLASLRRFQHSGHRQADRSTATVDNVATMEQLVSSSLSRRRLYAVLLAIFAGVAVALAAIGLYGLISYAVARRTREIGIRMALGARRSQVMGLVLHQSIVLTVLGIALGIAGAAAATRILEGMLFGLTPLDPSTYVAVAVLFALVASLAAFVPARRATKVDPMVALRVESDGEIPATRWYAMRQRRLDAELAEEMDFHRAMKRDEFERSGLRGADAEFASRRALGNLTLAREETLVPSGSGGGSMICGETSPTRFGAWAGIPFSPPLRFCLWRSASAPTPPFSV